MVVKITTWPLAFCFRAVPRGVCTQDNLGMDLGDPFYRLRMESKHRSSDFLEVGKHICRIQAKGHQQFPSRQCELIISQFTITRAQSITGRYQDKQTALRISCVTVKFVALMELLHNSKKQTGINTFVLWNKSG